MVEVAKKSDAEDGPVSSIIGRVPPCAFPGLHIDVDIDDTGLGGPGVLSPLVNALTAAVFLAEGIEDGIRGELYVRIVDNAAMQQLNHDHRGQDKPTNVLSFQAVESDDLIAALGNAAANGPPILFGDLIVAAPLVISEADQQNKQVMDHFSHLIVHGLLHLLGYDHLEDDEADVMETKEKKILADVGIADPYGWECDHG